MIVNNLRNLVVWIIIALLLLAVFNMLHGTGSRPTASAVSFTEFNREVVQGAVKKVSIQGNEIHGELSTGQSFVTYAPDDPNLVQRMLDHNVSINVQPTDDGMPTLMSIFINWVPFLLLIGVWIFFMRQMQSGGGKAMGFGKSRAKLLTERTGRVTFEDVAGVDEAKEELKEIVDFLRDPQKFQRLGGRIPKGVLLVGPPGTGKTLLARSIAGEANVPFFTISGSDFVEMFVGVGASRVRDMFEQAKKNAPCIVFIDEIDAVGRHRGAGLGGGNDEREQTLNQLLVEMDGFEANEGVILIAATNRPDVLDPALLRPGRFDRHVVVPNPDLAGREKILRVHLRKVPLAPDVDPRVIARGTPGFSGADLANLVNEAALLAARRGKRVVTMPELEDAKDKVLMGAERRSMAMSEEEKKLTAYHEGGHALVALSVEGSDPIHKATIIPRGRALGMVMRLPERDQLSVTRQKMLADLCVAFGGRIAEELIFGHDKVTTGAMSDIEQATRMARAMVTRYGMSDDLGPIAYGENQEEVFLGHSVSRTQNLSEATAQKIDSEIRRIIDMTYQRAHDILSERRADLEVIARGLLEYETLSGDEIVGLLKGIPPVRTPYEEAEPTRSGPSVPAAGRPRGPGILPEPQPGR
ncbi:MAG: ATP-dependent zinc metalloprotease FtsH [Alphaproteobacteria bacterium]|nr:ATP-dependent zinc metalloprotease FtsH [Alphaproteobacteria bacterium]MDE2073701.1 ATP-dependent zinc metalloprotease FtsH [Alphaproteobacteria bacterium]MDE2352528.1 ATP-dependent zinc metalloprotease FtsH [Alphaproteobacteria bacterium]